MSDAVISLQNIKKTFLQGKEELDVLQGASLDIKPGEIVGLIGPSGCGKSTFLQIAGLLDKANDGAIIIDGTNSTKASDRKRTKLRQSKLGFIYQFHHLLPEFSAQENVAIPQMINGVSKSKALTKAKEVLQSLGLARRLTHRPSELSGGEQQRVAIARAVATDPAILLADEPTGNLDPKTSDEVFNLLVDTARSKKLAMLIVTHNEILCQKMDRVVTISKGVIEEQKSRS